MTAAATARLDDARTRGRAIMVNDRTDGRRHLKLYKDDDGHYVRIGKRGQTKKYLTTERCLITDSLYEYGYRS